MPKFQQKTLDSVVDSLDKLIDALGQDVSDAVLAHGYDGEPDRAVPTSNVNELKNALDALQGARSVLAGIAPGAVTINVGVQS